MVDVNAARALSITLRLTRTEAGPSSWRNLLCWLERSRGGPRVGSDMALADPVVSQNDPQRCFHL